MPLLHRRPVVTILSVLLGGAGIVVAVAWRDHSLGPPLGAALVAAGVVGVLIAQRLRTPERVDPEDVDLLDEERRRELVRGTSLFLRDMEYRYSIRFDTRITSRMRSFATEVNGVRLGFIPVVVTDNTNDRQGFGYVAFVHDGARWRGPGLPCPDDPNLAVKHAARCVSPLATEEETRYEGT